MTLKETQEKLNKEFEEKKLIVHEIDCSVIQDGGECYCEGKKIFKSYLSRRDKVIIEAVSGDIQKDFNFLKEMYECSQKLIDRYDITVLAHLNKMIEDWKDELKTKIAELKVLK